MLPYAVLSFDCGCGFVLYAMATDVLKKSRLWKTQMSVVVRGDIEG